MRPVDVRRQAARHGCQVIFADFGARAKDKLPNFDIESFRSYTYRGYRLFALCTYELCVDARCFPQQLDPTNAAHRAIIERWFSRAAGYLDEADQWFARYDPVRVTYFQGYLLEAAILRALAVRRGIDVLAFERTAHKDKLLWEDVSGIAVNRNQAANHFWRWSAEVDPMEAEEYCAEYCRRARELKRTEHISADRELRLLDDRPILLVLGQVYSDSSLVHGLVHWSDPVQWFQDVVAAGLGLGFRIIIKLHPKEFRGRDVLDRPYDSLTHGKLREVPEIRAAVEQGAVEIDHTNALDTYDLIRKARLVTTINSQAGLEALVHGKPTIICGQAFYGGLGFTLEARSAAELRTAFIAANKPAGWAEKVQQARIFFQIFNERYCFALDSGEGFRRIMARKLIRR